MISYRYGLPRLAWLTYIRPIWCMNCRPYDRQPLKLSKRNTVTSSFPNAMASFPSTVQQYKRARHLLLTS